MLLIGTGKADITAYKEGSGMLGYAIAPHIQTGVETSLFARAFYFEEKDTERKVVLVNCELAFITPSLKEGVIKLLKDDHPHLGIHDGQLMLSAQHTHCAPTGYSFEGLYNMNGPGFIPETYEKLVGGIVEAIVAAEATKQSGRIQIGRSTFAPDIPVAFNRTVNSYNQNPEVTKYSFEDRHLAVDREMTMLQFVNETGTEIGSINWFAVHTTNLPNSFLKLCSDNKGFAATYLEEEKRKSNPNYIAAFAQGACGDVSARYKYNPKLPFQRGKYEGMFPDDLESSKYNGRLQYDKALEIIKSIPGEMHVGDVLDSTQIYLDFGRINVSTEFANGQENAHTSPACMGISFLIGSKMDGPSMHPAIGVLAKGLSLSVKGYEKSKAAMVNGDYAKEITWKYEAQGPKHIALETGARTIFGTHNVKNFIIPGFADDLIRNMKTFDRRGALKDFSWTPQILPLQILRIGSVVICGFPFEITTVSSWRLRKTIQDTLVGKNGIEHVILCPYSNAYSGYITTFEEYQVQDYEAGHCVFGQWALSALQQEFSRLGKQLLVTASERILDYGQPPIQFPAGYLDRFATFESNYYRNYKKRIARKAKKDKV
jgi:neutral ceramidase